MDLRVSYKNSALNPIYAGSGAIATMSADGALLATPVLDEINIVKLSPMRQIIHTIENDDEQEITALKLTADGQYLCFVSQAQMLKIFNVGTKKIIRSMKISSPSYVLDSDSTSTLIAIGGTDGSVTVVDIENGYITHSLKGHGGTISSLKFYGERNDTKWLLGSADTNGMVKVWDLVKRKCLHTIQEHTTAVRGIDFRPTDDNDILNLITGGRDNIVNFFEFNLKKKCKLMNTIAVHQQVESCGFVGESDPNLIYTAGGDAVFQLLSLKEEKIVKKTQKPLEELFIVGVLPILNGRQLFLVFSDQTLLLVNLEKELTSTEEFIAIDSCIAGNHGTVADIKSVGPGLIKLALATNSPALRIIPMPTQDLDQSLCIDVEIYEGHDDLLNSLDTTEDGLWLATGSKDNTAILWRYDDDLEKFMAYARFEGHASSVTAVGLPNVLEKGWPEFIITASNDLTIKKWSVPKLEKGGVHDMRRVSSSEYTFRAHDKDINALAVSPNDSLFATASYDKTCKVWDLDTGELKASLASHKRGLWDVSFCQYDKLLATCSGDKTIKIWNLETFTVIKSLEGHTNAVQRCSFINKQKQLVSSGADGLIKVWDCSTGDCLKTLDGHGNRIWALTVLDDGELIITADADGVFQFWRDCTEEQKEQDLEKEKVKVEQEQSLQNYMNEGDWTNAFLLAMTLDHPMRLFNVLRQSVSSKGSENIDSTVFNEELDKTISTLDDKQLLILMKRCRDWNTNARTHLIAQKTIKCILLHHNIADLSEIPGMVQVVESIIPYTKRHFSRIDDLIEQSYILDYSLVEMEKLY